MARLKNKRARAALVLFQAGFSFAEVARLLFVRKVEVLRLVRLAIRS